MPIKLATFVEQYNEAPFDFDEYAELAADVTDCPKLVAAANQYTEAKNKFEKALQDVGVEIG